MEPPAEPAPTPTPAPTELAPAELAPAELVPTPAPTPVPAELAPTEQFSSPNPGVESLFLTFDAIQSEPALEKIFLATGGSIAAAASRASTDFALTGSKQATVAELSDTYASTVKIELSPEQFRLSDDEEMTAVVSNRAKLLACTSQSGAAINGSIVSSITGQGGFYLSKVLRNGSSATALPLVYASWQAHSAVITASNFKLQDEKGRHYSIRFVKDDKQDSILKTAESVLSSWADGAWKMRQDVLSYPYSPSLTKCVARVPVGINDTGYSLVHDVAHPVTSEYSWETINSILKQGVNVDLEFVQEDVNCFLDDTRVPGLKAAINGGRTVAAAMSIMTNFLVSYRADGRTTVMPTGSVAVGAESWLRQAARIPGIEGNDCDGSCLAIKHLLSFVTTASPAVRAEFPFINAVYNVLVPHYQVGVSVLGASSAEASGGGKKQSDNNDEPAAVKHVAGHAVALMLPTMSVLIGLERGGRQTINGVSILEDNLHEPVAEARFASLYQEAVVKTMPEAEQSMFSSWKAAKESINAAPVEAYACEGTTPASPIMNREGQQAEEARETSLRDEKAFEKIGANIGRSIKILYAGGKPGTPLEHKFYSEFVEVTFARSNPLWANEKIRSLGAACTQLVFSRHDGKTKSLPVQMAGSTPAEIVKYEFALVPLVLADKNSGDILDFASSISDLDVMPPRPQNMQRLSKFQSEQLEVSLKHLENLNESLAVKMNDQEETESGLSHTVAYILAFSTLVNNPLAVKHMTDRIKEVAISGVVDSVEVEQLVIDHSGRQAGRLVVINAVVEL